MRPACADPYAARLIRGIHRAAEEGDALAADSVLRVLVARLVERHARAVLEERMAAPPTLEALAAKLGTSPFALLKAFRKQYGMPPHTWLTDARVRRARRLLDAGGTPADTDQPHLNRHFTRIVGVPPGAYRRERARTYKTGTHPAT